MEWEHLEGKVVIRRYQNGEEAEACMVLQYHDKPSYHLVNAKGEEVVWPTILTELPTPDQEVAYWRERALRGERFAAQIERELKKQQNLLLTP